MGIVWTRSDQRPWYFSALYRRQKAYRWSVKLKSYSVKNEPIKLTHNSHVILDRNHIAGIVQHIHKVLAHSVKSEHIIYLFICTLLLSGIHLQRFESPKQHLPGAPVHHIHQSPVTHSHWLQLTTKLTYITKVIKEDAEALPSNGSFPGSLCLRLPKTHQITTFKKNSEWKNGNNQKSCTFVDSHSL